MFWPHAVSFPLVSWHRGHSGQGDRRAWLQSVTAGSVSFSRFLIFHCRLLPENYRDTEILFHFLLFLPPPFLPTHPPFVALVPWLESLCRPSESNLRYFSLFLPFGLCFPSVNFLLFHKCFIFLFCAHSRFLSSLPSACTRVCLSSAAITTISTIMMRPG